MKKILITIACLSLLLCACSSNANTAATANTDASAASDKTSDSVLKTEILNEEVATLDVTTIDLGTVDDNLVNITNAGNYVLTGQFNGQIRVEVNNEAEVKLTLSNVNISNEGSGCIYFVSGSKLIVSSADDTVNYLTSTGKFIKSDDCKVDAVIFAKDDLQVSGHGTLIINSEKGHGISAKDDFSFKNCTLEINAGKKGIEVNDSATFKSGNLSIVSGGEGIEAMSVLIEDGIINIDSGDDGINASDGSSNGDNPQTAAQNGVLVSISGGDITIAAINDAIDSNGDVFISGGTLTVTSYGLSGDPLDFAIDYAGTYECTGGVLNVPENSIEGMQPDNGAPGNSIMKPEGHNNPNSMGPESHGRPEGAPPEANIAQKIG